MNVCKLISDYLLAVQVGSLHNWSWEICYEDICAYT